MDAQEAKKMVVEKWPDAEPCGPIGINGWCQIMSVKAKGRIVLSDRHQYTDAAWIDAASRLPVEPVASVELPTQPVADAQGETAQEPEASAEDNLECVHCGVYRKYWATSPKCLGDKHTGEGYEKSLRAPQIDHLAWISQALEVVQLYRNGYAPHDVADGLLEKYRQWDVPEKYRLSEIAKVQR